MTITTKKLAGGYLVKASQNGYSSSSFMLDKIEAGSIARKSCYRLIENGVGRGN